MELLHTSTAASPSISHPLHSSTAGVFFDLFERETNLSSSLDLLAASVETSLAIKAENSTYFASASTTPPGQLFALLESLERDPPLLSIFLDMIAKKLVKNLPQIMFLRIVQFSEEIGVFLDALASLDFTLVSK